MRLIDGLNTSRSFTHLLADLEARHPDRPILRFREAGARHDLTVAELAATARAYAARLRALGAQPGDRVAFLLPNSPDAAAFWFAAGMAGLIEVPVNTDLRGPVLAHVLTDSGPSLIVSDPEFLDAVAACGHEGDAPVIVWDDQQRAAAYRDPPVEPADPEPRSLATIMYTSGTTGPSKGVMLTHGYFANIGRFLTIVDPAMSGDDVLYMCTPMFHIDARLLMSATLIHGAVFAFAPRFSASTFWDDVRDLGVSFFVFVGAMVSILAKTSTVEQARGVRLRSGIGGPTPQEAYEFFEDRLGILLLEGFGMTECDGVTWSTPDRRLRGSVGWESGPYEVRVVSPTGEHLPPGHPGEIVVRPGAPNLMTIGYWHQAEATVDAFRDLWFHTGDLGRFDEDGYLTFLGRLKDVIRRRGENVSAFEVETVLAHADGVLECAAIGVADELGGEEDILVYVVAKEGASLDATTLFRYAEENLARFAVPRYLKLVDGLPHTPTGKVEKHRLSHGLDGVHERPAAGRRGGTRASADA